MKVSEHAEPTHFISYLATQNGETPKPEFSDEMSTGIKFVGQIHRFTVAVDDPAELVAVIVNEVLGETTVGVPLITQVVG